MFLYSAVLKRYLTRLGPQSRFGDKLLGIGVRYMFLYSAVLKWYLSRLGPQSRFGDKLLGIRVRYMFLYTAVLKRYLSRLGPQSRFRDKLLGIRVRYLFSVHGTKKTVSRTTLCRPVTPLIVRRWDEKTQHSHEVTAAAAAAAAAAEAESAEPFVRVLCVFALYSEALRARYPGMKYRVPSTGYSMCYWRYYWLCYAVTCTPYVQNIYDAAVYWETCLHCCRAPPPPPLLLPLLL